MRVLDLFSGEGGFSRPFRDRGHEVVTVDIDPSFQPDVKADVRRLEHDRWLLGEFDVILASPPCEGFSLAGIPHHGGWKEPDETVVMGLGLVACTFKIIASAAPKFWVVENPRATLRTWIGPPKETVFLCSFGARWMKPTDLWGRYPGLVARPCAPHEESPRGSKTGVQRVRRPSERAELPSGLGDELCRRMEEHIYILKDIKDRSQ